MEYIKVKKACQILGVHPNTIRKWVDEGKFKYVRISNQRRILKSDVLALVGETNANTSAIYARVSSHSQKDDLEQQIKTLKEHGGDTCYVLQDIASGLKTNRKGLNKLIDLAQGKKINKIFFTYKDRLTRFGYEYLENLFLNYGVKLCPLFDDIKKEPHDELVSDLMSLVASFSGRLYGLRSHKVKEAQESIQKVIDA